MAERSFHSYRAQPGQLLCSSLPGPYGFRCTRADGHPHVPGAPRDDRHMAQGTGETYCRWPDSWQPGDGVTHGEAL